MKSVLRSKNMTKRRNNEDFMLVILLLILFANDSYSQKSEFRKIDNKAFKLGEKLTFEVNYGFITAGYAEYSIPKIVKIARH